MFEEFENKIFNTPIGDFIGVNINSPHTHLIHVDVYLRDEVINKWYMGSRDGKIITIELNTSKWFLPSEGYTFHYATDRWIPVNILDRTNPTLEEIKEQIKF